MSYYLYNVIDKDFVYRKCTNSHFNNFRTGQEEREFSVSERQTMDKIPWLKILTDLKKPTSNVVDFDTILSLYVPVNDIGLIKDICCMEAISSYLDGLDGCDCYDYENLTKEEVEKVGCPYWVYQEFMEEKPFTFSKDQFHSLLKSIHCDEYILERLKTRRRESIIEEMNCNFDITKLIIYLYNVTEDYLCQLYNDISMRTTFDILKAIMTKDVARTTITSECSHTILVDFYNQETINSKIEW